jgi:hypothetical protein
MQGKHGDAADAFTRSAQGAPAPRAGFAYYHAASEYAQAGRKDDAIAMLGKAFDGGYPNRSRVASDPHFASIVADPRVRQMLAAK